MIALSSLHFSPDDHRLAYISGGMRREAEARVRDVTPMPEEPVGASPPGAGLR